ncbi:MAG: HYR domain-containing protein [Thermoproteota archaeon]|nr:HYR domain-containing protein [Thermoproteota archaeon]
MLLGSVALFFFLAAAILLVGSPLLVTAQQIGTTTTTTPTPPLTPEEQEEQNRLQNVIAATNQNLDEAEKEVNGIVYTPRWSDVVWVEPGALSVLFAYCLPGEFAESGQEILGGFELEVLESYEIALAQGFMAWMMVVGNEDRQDRLPAAVGVICASDTNDVETRVISPQEQQQINNVVQQFITTQVTNIEQVINIINNVTTNATTTGPVTPPPPTNDTGGTPPPPPGGGGGLPEPQVPGGIPEDGTIAADTTPPVFDVVPISVNYPTDDPEGVQPSWLVKAVDNVDGTAELRNNILTQDNVGGAIAISCDPPAHSTFPVGTTTVQCTAVDRAGNVETYSFTIAVQLVADPGAPGGTTGGTPLPPRERLEGIPPPPAEEEQQLPAPTEEAPEAPAAEEEEAATAPPANDEGGGGGG